MNDKIATVSDANIVYRDAGFGQGPFISTHDMAAAITDMTSRN
jgi:hypothetical protein